MQKTHLVRRLIILVLYALAGCTNGGLLESTWHQKVSWRAEDYFDDPNVIELCRAIEANDIAEMNRLIAAGADVNAIGKGKMTPLLWSFFDNKLDRFKLLLEHGADPNVVVENNFQSHGAVSAGDSVTHLACKTRFPGYFDAVMAHGANPNLPNTSTVGARDTPIFTVIKSAAPDKRQRIQTLIKKGADLSYQNSSGGTPTMVAVGWAGQFDIALMLLEAGADYRKYQQNELQKLAHVVARQERRLSSSSPKQRADYQSLVKWLADHGESVEQASADIKRWDSWSGKDYPRKSKEEIAARKAKEAQETSAPK